MQESVKTGAQFLQDLEDSLLARERNLDYHPLIVGVRDGTLTPEEVLSWAKQAFYIHSSFGSHLDIRDIPGLEILDTDEELAHEYWEARVEEEWGAISRTAGHGELFMRLCEGLGATRLEVLTTKRSAPLNRYLDYVLTIRKSVPFIVSTIAIGTGLESQVPRTWPTLYRGLRDNYGVTEEAALFFPVHFEADEEHSAASARLVEEYIDTPELQAQVWEITHGVVKRFWPAWMPG